MSYPSSCDDVTGHKTKKPGVNLYGILRWATVSQLLYAVCVSLPALLIKNRRVKKNISSGMLTNSSGGRNSTASCPRKAVCSAADWRNIKLCGVDDSDDDQRIQLVQLQKRWQECTKLENVCDECAELGIREELNLTWIRFAEYVTNPPNKNVAQRNKTSRPYKPVIILCDTNKTGLSICNGRSVNVSYLLQGGYKGQDCMSTEYLLGLPYGPHMIDEVIGFCSKERE
jgi:hypothetical protein